MMSPASGVGDAPFAGGAVRFDRTRIASPDVSLFDPHAAHLDARPVHEGGRQAAWYVAGEFGAGLLRHYRRGGLAARLSRDRYVWTGAENTRSFAEFDLLRFMRQRDLPVPAPLAAAYWRDGPVYRAAILIDRIPGVSPLAKRLPPASCGPVARAIFAMHEAGVWHADLNAYNILLDGRDRVWLIDFDRGRRLALSRRRRQANLRRLRRSLIKTDGAAGLLYWEGVDRAYRDLMAAGNSG